MLEPLTSLVPAVQKIHATNELEAQISLRRYITSALQRDAKKARRFLRQVLDGAVFDDEQLATMAATKLRMEAAHLLLDRAGYVPPKAGEPNQVMKDPSEMGSDELRVFLARAERELGNRAFPVDSAPIAPDPNQQVLDMLE